ncbi:serine/threonine protein kinase [Streptacidiphilus sp. MAP12-16]|uniref:serine/threonine-protein kinase n=1 Tax=Streptacidiphilus sp. MAP12-16 TaxID=3156300 RepID=UPI003516911B
MEWVVPGYRHTRELGAGASGRVVLALHEATGTPVAVKYLADELRADADFLEEFRAEARLLGELDTPYVVRLWEYVEGPQGAAIVMELVDGIALRALLRQAGATGPEAALVVLKGSLLGLAAAHAMGVVHRDYKPENVLVAADGSSKLVDFGIAVHNGQAGDVAGTPPYMAPEQWAGDPASAAADVYAATATFFECLTGSRPYPGTEFAELVVQHTTAPIPDELAPEAVRPLIRRGLAKAADDRPSSAAAFVEELEAVAGTAYGPDWEERGQRKLAAIAALLPLLFPSAGGVPSGTTALATTVLGGGVGPGRGAGRIIRKKVLVSGVAGGIVLILLGGGYASGVIGGSPRTSPVAHPTPIAVTSLSPSPTTSPSASVAASPSPSASASASASASVSPSPSASASTSPSASPSPSPTVSPTPSPTPSASPSKSPTPPPPPVTHVTSVTVDAWAYDSATNVGTIYANITTDGTGSITVTANAYVNGTGYPGGTFVGSQSVSLRGGKSYVRIRVGTFTFPYSSCSFAVAQLSTSPAAANGSPYASGREQCIT